MPLQVFKSTILLLFVFECVEFSESIADIASERLYVAINYQERRSRIPLQEVNNILGSLEIYSWLGRMETIFDIFGSRDPIKPPTLNTLPQRFSAIKSVPSEGLLPGKQGTKNEGPTLKGKKVLSDVGNRIKGLKSNKESDSSDSYKKSQQESYCVPSISCSSTDQVGLTETLEKNILKEKPLTSQLIWEDGADFNDIDKWPEVETHGPSFWSDDHYGSTWPDIELPSIQNFCHTANIWDIETKTYAEELSHSPISREYGDDIQFCLDLPSDNPSEMVLDDSEVKFPWEM